MSASAPPKLPGTVKLKPEFPVPGGGGGGPPAPPAEPIDLSPATISLLRWGTTNGEPRWLDGAVATAPAASAALVTKTVGANKTGQVYGIHIMADEANDFVLLIGKVVLKKLALGSAGEIFIQVGKSLLDTEAFAGGAQPTTVIQVQNVNAGTAGQTYQASILYSEG